MESNTFEKDEDDTWVFFKSSSNQKFKTFKIKLTKNSILEKLTNFLKLKKDKFEYKFVGKYSHLEFTENSLIYIKEKKKEIMIEECLKMSRKRKREKYYIIYNNEDEIRHDAAIIYDDKPLLEQLKCITGISNEEKFCFYKNKYLKVSEKSLSLKLKNSEFIPTEENLDYERIIVKK